MDDVDICAGTSDPPRSTRPYHHGDLRADLVARALDILRDTPPEALSLRALAWAAGVSHNAPYMHFKDKDALLRAVADEGFARMGPAIVAALDRAGDNWRARLTGGCLAYCHFARDHASWVRVMLRPRNDADETAGAATIALLSRELAQGIDAGHLAVDDPDDTALMIWSLLHGCCDVVSTMEGGPLPDPGIAFETRIIGFLDRIFTGLVVRDGP
ncbi:MAG: TetR/AcrR family transcriptional regulator [Pseudomonadota bacterium]